MSGVGKKRKLDSGWGNAKVPEKPPTEKEAAVMHAQNLKKMQTEVMGEQAKLNEFAYGPGDMTLDKSAPTAPLGKKPRWESQPSKLSEKGKWYEDAFAGRENDGPHESPVPAKAGRGRGRRGKKTAGRRRRSSSLSAMLGKPLKMLMGKKTRKHRRGGRR